MDESAKKTALRMVPYGIYVLTAEGEDGTVAASTVNWVTQASFSPPLIVVAVKADSKTHGLVTGTGRFALNVLGKEQAGVAFGFFKPLEREGNTIGGQAFGPGENGAPILESAQASLECSVVETVGKGDHTVVVAEVTAARVNGELEGRADEASLHMKDLGENVFYGG